MPEPCIIVLGAFWKYSLVFKDDKKPTADPNRKFSVTFGFVLNIFWEYIK